MVTSTATIWHLDAGGRSRPQHQYRPSDDTDDPTPCAFRARRDGSHSRQTRCSASRRRRDLRPSECFRDYRVGWQSLTRLTRVTRSSPERLQHHLTGRRRRRWQQAAHYVTCHCRSSSRRHGLRRFTAGQGLQLGIPASRNGNAIEAIATHQFCFRLAWNFDWVILVNRLGPGH